MILILVWEEEYLIAHSIKEENAFALTRIFEKFAIKSAMSNYMLEHTENKYIDESSPAQSPVCIPRRDDMKHKVFISYSRKDIESVTKIRIVLEEIGIPYWIDKEGIYSGENYKEVIVDAIDTAKVVLFISSKNSNTSIKVIREIGYAVKHQKTIIPILLDDSPYAKSVSLDISDIDQIDIYKDGENAKKKLAASLAYRLEML